jgi:hypothetical protein
MGHCERIEGGREGGRARTYLCSDEAALEDRVLHGGLDVVQSEMKRTIHLNHDGEEGWREGGKEEM